MSALAQRLSRDPELVLPGSMTRPDAPPVSDTGKEQYVSSLLQHDPGVFLERLGDKLNATELASFEPLRSDYEVGRQLFPFTVCKYSMIATNFVLRRPCQRVEMHLLRLTG